MTVYRLMLKTIEFLSSLSLMAAVLLCFPRAGHAEGGLSNFGGFLPSLPASSLPSLTSAGSPATGQSISAADTVAPLAGFNRGGTGMTDDTPPSALGVSAQTSGTNSQGLGQSSGQNRSAETPILPGTFDPAWQTKGQILEAGSGQTPTSQTPLPSGTFDPAWQTKDQILEAGSGQTPTSQAPLPLGTFDQAWNVTGQEGK